MNSEISHSTSNSSFTDEIGLREFFMMLWNDKITLILIIILAATFSVYFALSQPNIYSSTALLSPANNSSNNSSSISSRYGGLASLAGISVDNGQVSDVGLGIEILKSRVFIVDFIKRRDILVTLFAMKSWDGESSKIIYNDYYDQESKKWLGDWPGGEPSYQEAFEKFTQMMTVIQNKKNGLVTISITHQSPVIAQQWTMWLVEDINKTMRNRAVTEAKNSILFLQKEIESTKLSELRVMFSRMIEEQTKTIMLANVRPEYLFTVIDPPIIPERKTGPIRSQISIIGTILGAIFGILYLFLRRYGPELFSEN